MCFSRSETEALPAHRVFLLSIVLADLLGSPERDKRRGEISGFSNSPTGESDDLFASSSFMIFDLEDLFCDN